MLKKGIFLSALCLIMILVGCTGTGTTRAPSSPTAPTPTSLPTDTSLPPTVTPLPPVGVFLAGPEADPALVEELKPLVSEWVRKEGLRFQSLEEMSGQDFEQEQYRMVVALPPQPDLQTLVEAAPDTDFLAVGFSGLEAQDNLSVILPGQGLYDQHGFMAGYLAALITRDWRVGVIGLSENPAAQQARSAFSVGVKYFCGLCRPEHPPFYEYPLSVTLPGDATAAQWRASADVLVKQGVETIYVVPGAGDQELLAHLVDAGAQVIGDARFYTQEIADGWVASLGFDLATAFKEYWPQFTTGKVGEEIPVPLIISDVNHELLSPGRLQNARAVLELVSEGWIKTTLD